MSENFTVQSIQNKIKANQTSIKQENKNYKTPKSKPDKVELSHKKKTKKAVTTAVILGGLAAIGGVATAKSIKIYKGKKIIDEGKKLLENGSEKAAETINDILTNKKILDIQKVLFAQKSIPETSKITSEHLKAGKFAMNMINAMKDIKISKLTDFTLKNPKFNTISKYTHELIENPLFAEITKTDAKKLVNGIPEDIAKKLELLTDAKKIYKESNPMLADTWTRIDFRKLASKELNIRRNLIEQGNLDQVDDFIKALDDSLKSMVFRPDKLRVLKDNVNPLIINLEYKSKATGQNKYQAAINKIEDFYQTIINPQKTTKRAEDLFKGKIKMSIGEAKKTLGIKGKLDPDSLKKAYRKESMKCHPDKVATMSEEVQNASKEKFQKIGEAYEVLKKHLAIK